MSEANPSTLTANAPAGKAGGKLRRRLLIGGVVLALAAAGAAAALLARGRSTQTGGDLPIAKVVRGSMTVSVTETGEVKAEEQEVITNPITYPVYIKEVIAEGKIVEAGQLIIRMECKQLNDSILDQDLRVRAADDEYLAASNKLIVTRKQMDSRLSKTKQAVEDAKSDLKKYEEAEWPQQRDEADSRISLAKRDLKLAMSKLESKKQINAAPELKQPYSKNEIEADELSVQRLELAVTNAQTDKRVLVEYTYPRTLRNKKIAVSDTELDLETASLDAATQIKLAEGADASAKDRLTKQQGRLKELNEDLAKLTVVAKKPGLIVYETRRRPWQQPVTVAVDEKIEPGQQLMIIPNMQTLQVQTRVYEAVREQVNLGLPALIRLDAKRGTVIHGRVCKVAPLPDSQNPWLSPGVKVYPTTVAFCNPGDCEGLKPGMTADVEVLLARLENVLTVPIAAVFSEGETSFCFRQKGDGECERVEIQIGKTSDSVAEAVCGLNEGDTVLLAPPPGVQVGSKLSDRKKQEAASQPAIPASMPNGEHRLPASRPGENGQGRNDRRGT